MPYVEFDTRQIGMQIDRTPMIVGGSMQTLKSMTPITVPVNVTIDGQPFENVKNGGFILSSYRDDPDKATACFSAELTDAIISCRGGAPCLQIGEKWYPMDTDLSATPLTPADGITFRHEFWDARGLERGSVHISGQMAIVVTYAAGKWLLGEAVA